MDSRCFNPAWTCRITLPRASPAHKRRYQNTDIGMSVNIPRLVYVGQYMPVGTSMVPRSLRPLDTLVCLCRFVPTLYPGLFRDPDMSAFTVTRLTPGHSFHHIMTLGSPPTVISFIVHSNICVISYLLDL